MNRKTSRPRLRRPLALRLALENLRLFLERNIVRVSTPGGFPWLPVVMPETRQHLVNLPHGVPEFVRRGRDWYLMPAVKTEDVSSRDDLHFGLDSGLANLAVPSGPGVVELFDGKHLRHMRGRYFRYRQALQKKRKTGMVKRSKSGQSRWVRCENDRVSRHIVDAVVAGHVIPSRRGAGRHPGRDQEGGPYAARMAVRATPWIHPLQGGAGRRPGRRRRPAAHQPAVQPLPAKGTRQPIPAGSFSIPSLWPLCTCGPECRT